MSDKATKLALLKSQKFASSKYEGDEFGEAWVFFSETGERFSVCRMPGQSWITSVQWRGPDGEFKGYAHFKDANGHGLDPESITWEQILAQLAVGEI